MGQGPSASSIRKESFFLWSKSGIHRIRKRVKPAGRTRKSDDTAAGRVAPEHRRYPRLDLRFPILYKVLGGSSQRLPADVRPYLLAQSANVSPLGLCLNLGEPLAPGTVLALTLHVPESRERFHAVGRVTWTQPAPEPGHFLTGIQFVVVEGESVKREEHSRMEALIRELEPG